MLQVHRDVMRQIEAIPVRSTTRTEIYRRLHAAKDHIDGAIGSEILLADMAAIACMSTHHFLRLFKKTFGETPHQYLSR
jgi:AraC-like DNA-binding protein